MAAPAMTPSVQLRGDWRDRAYRALSGLRPVWSRAGAMRALRTTLVMPGLFALTSQVIKNGQMATFAAFGSFATLVLASFVGSWRDKLVAHLGLAVAGSILLTIGTAVNSVTAIAAVVTLVVAFCVLFLGIAGPNFASAGVAALLAYVLPAASPGAMSMVPSRLAGWWLASSVGTLAVLLLPSPAVADRVRSAASAAATAFAGELEARLAGRPSTAERSRSDAAELAMSKAFIATPFRPTGIGASSQALGHVVEDLELVGSILSDIARENVPLDSGGQVEESLLRSTLAVLRDTGVLLAGGDAQPCVTSLEEAGRLAARAAEAEAATASDSSVDLAFHAGALATVTRSAGTDALIASRRAVPEVIARERERWARGSPGEPSRRRRGSAFDLFGHASLRSVWFLNSARGAIALAGAVAAADLTNAQHGFWVVLGTLSVLRTNAASTGANALRALAGTAFGFFIGAGLILLIGSHTDVLWAALPVAVLVAAYTPGTAPFAVGQAAFTVTLLLLYNIIVPVGWKVGVVRIEDIAIGAGVSVVAGILFWPRGAGAVVGDDLAETFRLGGVYLAQATAWAVGVRSDPPDVAPPLDRAGRRLDSALRGLSIEQGTKRFPKEALWKLVGGSTRLRLSGQSLASTSSRPTTPGAASRELVNEAVRIAGVAEAAAERIGRTPTTVARELASAPVGGVELPAASAHLAWVSEHLRHVSRTFDRLGEPLEQVARGRARSWWR